MPTTFRVTDVTRCFQPPTREGVVGPCFKTLPCPDHPQVTRVYNERQVQKQDADDYKRLARRWMQDAFGDGGAVEEYANVHPLPDGAFVEAQVWVPRADIEALRTGTTRLDPSFNIKVEDAKRAVQPRYTGNEF